MCGCHHLISIFYPSNIKLYLHGKSMQVCRFHSACCCNHVLLVLQFASVYSSQIYGILMSDSHPCLELPTHISGVAVPQEEVHNSNRLRNIHDILWNFLNSNIVFCVLFIFRLSVCSECCMDFGCIPITFSAKTPYMSAVRYSGMCLKGGVGTLDF